MTARSRRTVLAGLAGFAGLLAGCSSGTDGVAGRTTTAQATTHGAGSVFESTEVREGRLIVTLRSDANVDTVNLIAPDGSLFAREQVAAGQTRVAFTLVGQTGSAYRPGEQTLVAVDDDEVVEEHTFDLTPEVRIVDVVIARDRPDLDWEVNRPRWDEFGAVILENTGTGPDYVRETRWKNNPLSIATLAEEGFDFSGGLLPAQSTSIIYTRDRVFAATVRNGLEQCRKAGTLQLEVTALTRVGEPPVWASDISYEYDTENSDCTVTLSRRASVSDGSN